MNPDRTVLMVAFEATPFVKVGGLAEVPSNLAKELVALGWRAYLALPSHAPPGRRGEEPVARFATPLGEVFVGRASWGGVTYLLFSGSALSDERVYAGEVMDQKVKLFSYGLSLLLLNAEKYGVVFPDVIHFHDWHSVYALVKVKHDFQQRKARTLFHVHLLVKKHVDPSIFEQLGVPLGWRHEVRVNGRSMDLTLGDVLRVSGGIAEKIGALEADRLVTVSESYLLDDVLPFVGGEFRGKSRVIYNATTWSLRGALEEVLGKHGQRLRSFAGRSEGFRRTEIRKYFLLRALGELEEGEPEVPDERIKKLVYDLADPPMRGQGKVEPFMFDGPLAITTGRLARQKGFDLMVEAVPRVLRELGEAKFVFLVLPVWGGEDYVYQLADLQREYPENVRAVFGVAPSIYKLAHLASDVFFAPSRWEPFGIMALEAMSTGNPLVASRTGGLKEIVLDVNVYAERGTGILVRPDDPYELAEALRDLLAFMEASNTGRIEWYAGKIENKTLRRMLEEYPDAGEILRKNCVDRVEKHFSWAASARTADSIYRELLEGGQETL
ncbi:glycogen synthase [Thermofilum pendens]|uniref:Starch synthase n=1 Tax=Thermofilum pendens (strain DSM 2475 / Hrk 5) TaxID=368408 RepID=A1RYB4_THEPD|nr:glycogen/starch synthase [Thermofilum pendens]ABL78194.1 Starch synthase [Thermofilum pendens Hrk 5]